MEKKRLVIFDFCETLVRFQSADKFVDFVREDLRSPRMRYRECFRTILSFLRVLRGESNKRAKLLQLEGLPKPRLEAFAERFVEERIRPNLIGRTTKILEQHLDNGDEVVIVSGGYSQYLNVFASQVGVKIVVATDIDFSDGVCTGRIAGDNCMGELKVKKLRDRISLDEYDLEDSYVYTDDIKDLPLLDLVGNKVLVTKHPNDQLAEQYGLQQIVWSH
ncbi:MAG: HAD-IB family hydrolase [Deltaproteobacteria bacterium]|nr:HAD-IB family hydrolase [Deltaproteobacteria bacterium]